MMLKASSPYAKRVAWWNDHRKHFGKNDSSVLVWQADTRTMNPSVPESFIAAAYEDDASAASAEYGATFRSDIESFIAREAVDACVVPGRFELPPRESVRYVAFVDAAGGSGADSMAVASAHRVCYRAPHDFVRAL